MEGRWGGGAGSPQVRRHKYAAPVRCLFLPVCACAQSCLSMCLFIRLFLCVFVCAHLLVCVCVCVSQQEQPKCVPLMSSCGRPPAKSQRLALVYTPPSMSPFLSLHFTFCSSNVSSSSSSSSSLPYCLSVCLSFFIICPC